MKILLLSLILFPLMGALFHVLAGRFVPRRWVETVACAGILLSFLAALAAIAVAGDATYTVTFFNWFTVDTLSAAMDVYYDRVAALMALMVTFVSSLIHIYSVSYMREDEDYVRYFCYLNLFVFFMLVITLANNLIFLFLGWEGVGFCSFALIGFWYSDAANATAGRKAFIMTRIGDVAFGIAIGLFFVLFRNLSIPYINSQAMSMDSGTATILGLLLLWSAVGKSAQLPLTVWLPDAMAGPTPVSALIHAATMVTAGVYLLIRLFPVISLSPTAMTVIAVTGGITAFYAACSALSQRDIKKVLAYSTISQVGYMFLAVGAGDLIGSFSHLLSHAFFKALLFLAAGCVIQALHEEHNIFAMGKDVRIRLPVVFLLTLAGALSLGAVPPTAGFIGKDRILLAVFGHAGFGYKLLWALGALTALLTALYSFRLLLLVFTGEPFERREHPIADIPRPMVSVLWPLAFPALFAGALNLPPIAPGAEWLARYLALVPGSTVSLGIPHVVEWNLALLDSAISVGGALLALLLYGPKGVLRTRELPALGRMLREVLFSGFYLDRFYQVAIAGPYRTLAGILWRDVDERGVDRGVISSGQLFPYLSLSLRLWTTGRLSTYLAMLLLGFTAILCLFIVEL